MTSVKELGPVDLATKLTVVFGEVQSQDFVVELMISLQHLDELPDF